MQFISLLNEEGFCWLQQDGTTLHTANSIMEMVRQFFDGMVISKNLWPLQSPDYFLWGYLKQVVYSNRPQTIEDLKQNTEVAISNISQETLKKVVRNMVTRVNTCYAENGGHFQHVLQNLVSCFLNMSLYIINCFIETRPTDCHFTPWVA
jgi:hypothetical protein